MASIIERTNSLFDPVDMILACPHKWYLLEKLNNGILFKSSLYNDSHMRRLSIDRHVSELQKENLINVSDDGLLSITEKGAHLVQDLFRMKKTYQKHKSF